MKHKNNLIEILWDQKHALAVARAQADVFGRAALIICGRALNKEAMAAQATLG